MKESLKIYCLFRNKLTAVFIVVSIEDLLIVRNNEAVWNVKKILVKVFTTTELGLCTDSYGVTVTWKGDDINLIQQSFTERIIEATRS